MSQRGSSWPSRERLPQAVGSGSRWRRNVSPSPPWSLGLALVGCVVAALRPRLRWLLAVHLGAGALFVLVAGSDGRISRLVSAAWWDDPFRLAALVGVAGIPLAAVGLDSAVSWVASHVVAGRRASRHPGAAWAPPVLAGAVAVVALALAAGWQTADTTRVVASTYRSETFLHP